MTGPAAGAVDLAQAATWSARQQTDQFPGPGARPPPTWDNTHQAARAVSPTARVVYAGTDPAQGRTTGCGPSIRIWLMSVHANTTICTLSA